MKHPLPKEFVSRRLDVAVVGCGGNGSQMLNGLARLHFALLALGHNGLYVTAIDPDTVSEANVGRQLFSPADIGQYKADILINRLNLYYGLNWTAIKGRLGPGKPGQLIHRNSQHILIGCVDSIRSRQWMSQHGYLLADYWLDLGNKDKTGQVILGEFKPSARDRAPDPAAESKRLPNVVDMFPELAKRNAKEDDAPSCSLAEALERQDLFINQAMATWALHLLWSFIRNGGLDIHGYFINLETGMVRPLPIK